MSLKHVFSLGLILTAGVAFAEHHEGMHETAKVAAASSANMWYAISAAFCMGLAALGGTLSQSRALSAALEGIARNPGAADKVFTPMIVGLALIESLVLFGLAIAYLIIANIA